MFLTKSIKIALSFFISVIILSATNPNIKYNCDSYSIPKNLKEIFSSQVFHFPTILFTDKQNNEVLISENPSIPQHQTLHFYSDQIPQQIIDYYQAVLDLNNRKINLSDSLDSLITISPKVDLKYFTTKMGIRLGMTKKEIVNIYGEPFEVNDIAGYTVLVWDFFKQYEDIIDEKYLENLHLEDKYGYRITIYFKNDKAYFINRWNFVP